MKKLVSYAIFLVCCVANAQTWKMSEVTGKDKSIVGYIYHTSATGTKIGDKQEKAFASLRLVCSTKSNAPPLVVLYWNGMNGSGNKYPLVQIDGKQVTVQQEVWIQESNILYRTVYSDDQLMKLLKTSSKVTFS